MMGEIQQVVAPYRCLMATLGGVLDVWAVRDMQGIMYVYIFLRTVPGLPVMVYQDVISR